jgi:hypothetical protein
MNRISGQQMVAQRKMKQRYGQEITNQEWFPANEIPDSVMWILSESQNIVKGKTMMEGELQSNWDMKTALKNYPILFKLGQFSVDKMKADKGELQNTEGLVIADYAGQEYYNQTQAFHEQLLARGFAQNPTLATKRIINDFNNETDKERLNAVISRHDFPALLAEVPIISLMIPTRRQHFLTGLIENITSDNLEFQVGEFTPVDGVRYNIGEFEVPTEIGLGAYTFTPIRMTRAGWHMALSEEVAFMDYTQPIEQHLLDSIRGAMDEVLDRAVADELASASITDEALGSWSAVTGGISNRQAWLDLDTVLNGIDEDKALAQHIVSQRRARINYETNTHVNGGGVAVATTPGAVSLDRRNNVRTGVKFFEELDWTVDNLYPNATSIIALSEQAGILARGPTRLSSYLDVLRSIRGTVSKMFFAVDIFRFDLIKRGTSVAP